MAALNMPVGIKPQDGIFREELDHARGVQYALRMASTILAQNIAALRKHLDLTQEQLAARLDTTQANISKWEKKGVEPGGKAIAAMADLAKVSATEFSNKKWSPSKPPKPSTENPSLEDIAAEYGWALIEEIDLALGMGATFLEGAAPPESLGMVPFKMDWLRDMHHGLLSHLKVVRGKGDSMEPTIRDGDFVLVDTSHTRLDEQDAIWAVSYGDLGMIRRLRQIPGGGVHLMPDNSVVRPIDAYDGEMHIMGRVIWIGRKM